MQKSIALVAILLFGTVGCMSMGGPPPVEMTQLQIRQFQTRTYQTDDQTLVMKAMINVLQDDNYILKNADSDLGFLTATKEIDVASRKAVFWSTFVAGDDARWKKNSVVECSANVTQMGSECRVRANFQMKVLDNVGNVVSVEPVTDEAFFQEFFAKVDKGIFLQREKI